MLAMFILTVINVLNIGIFGATALGNIVSVVAAVSAATLTAGWISKSQRMAELGLLLACFVWTTRASFALIFGSQNGDTYGWAFSIAWAVASGGAYLLERADGSNKHSVIG